MHILPVSKTSAVIRFLNARLTYALHFFAVHYTALALLVFMTAGCILIFIASYIFRYNNYDYWHWKEHAASRAVCWCIILIAAKIILRGFTN